MKRLVASAALVACLVVTNRGFAGDAGLCPPPEDRFLCRIAPVGGWHPYWGGLLSWYDPNCFPRCCGPDDYCRKTPPPLCRPPYPPFYTRGLPESCAAPGPCVPSNKRP